MAVKEHVSETVRVTDGEKYTTSETTLAANTQVNISMDGMRKVFSLLINNDSVTDDLQVIFNGSSKRRTIKNNEDFVVDDLEITSIRLYNESENGIAYRLFMVGTVA